MLAGLENLPSVWNTNIREPALGAPMSQSGMISPLLADPVSMASPIDAFSELFPGPSVLQREQSLPLWNAQPLDFPIRSSPQWQGARYSSAAAPSLPEPQYYEGVCHVTASVISGAK